jgi:Bacterial regulatory proteins, tetR family
MRFLAGIEPTWKEPSQERSRERVAAVLSAARELIAEGGLASLKTGLLAERAGVPIGTIYQFFPDKEPQSVIDGQKTGNTNWACGCSRPIPARRSSTGPGPRRPRPATRSSSSGGLLPWRRPASGPRHDGSCRGCSRLARDGAACSCAFPPPACSPMTRTCSPSCWTPDHMPRMSAAARSAIAAAAAGAHFFVP